MRAMTIAEVGRLLSIKLPPAGRKGFCPFRKHKRKDKTFRVYKSKKSGDELYKCWSCDPPGNVGDAIALYAKLQNIDRRSAYQELEKHGFDVPDSLGREAKEPRGTPRRANVVPVAGTNEGPFLDLNLADWQRWRKTSNGLLSSFAEQRKLSSQLLRQLDVVEIDQRCIGFGYRHPETLLPCRVKVRATDKKMFWIAPRGGDDDNRKAYSPLYLAHDLDEPELEATDDLGSAISACIIFEGELDALTARQMRYRNVVSLPDGAASAGQVSLEPIQHFTHWYVATDNDEEGMKAWTDLRERSYQLNVQVARLKWGKVVGNVREGEEVIEHKDANAALMAGFGRDDFERCIRIAGENWFGQQVEVK
jgi:hypothetical protein